MTKHTKEPWYTGTDWPDGQQIIAKQKDGLQYVVATAHRNGDDHIANAQRIVACINACAGVSDEQLAHIRDCGGVHQLALAYDAEIARARQLEQRCDELLQALTLLVDLPEADGTQETAAARRDAKRTARTLINIANLELRS